MMIECSGGLYLIPVLLALEISQVDWIALNAAGDTDRNRPLLSGAWSWRIQFESSNGNLQLSVVASRCAQVWWLRRSADPVWGGGEAGVMVPSNLNREFERGFLSRCEINYGWLLQHARVPSSPSSFVWLFASDSHQVTQIHGVSNIDHKRTGPISMFVDRSSMWRPIFSTFCADSVSESIVRRSP